MRHLALLQSASLADLAEPAVRGEPFTRRDLERVLATGNPLAAAALADLRREASSGVVVTYPVTLRVRVPGFEAPTEDASKISFPLADIDRFESTEMEILGTLPADAPLAKACELITSVAHSVCSNRPIRALTADDVLALAKHERRSFADVLHVLALAGVQTLNWRSGGDASREAVLVHRAAHEAGMRTFAPVAYARGAAFLDRLDALRDVAEATKGFLSAVLLPERTEGASPLDGTSGTEDFLACALTRLALGHVVPHVTVDAHVLGHKLGAALLSAGADDFVGAQAALAWAPPTDDGPRPLNPARATKYVIEARRSPVRRDGRFALLESAS